MNARRQLLRDALERDDRKMSPVGEELNRQVEPEDENTVSGLPKTIKD